MNKIVTHTIIGVVSLGAGGAAGFLLGKRIANKKADARIETINNYWGEHKLAEEKNVSFNADEAILGQPRPQEDQTTKEYVEGDTPVFDQIKAETGPITLPGTSVIDQASEMLSDDQVEDDEELPPDFPEAPVVDTDEFVLEGQNPPLDAQAFIDKFRARAVSEFGGVSFPGQVTEDGDAEQPDITIKTPADWVTVRDPQGPYVISYDEYMDPESDPPFSKTEMRWFRGDNVIVDARDEQVPMSTVGQRNTDRFGEGTVEPDMVYIRNERLGLDIELLREDGLYLYEVLGQPDPGKPAVLKMRGDDDI